jgi:predicted transcriptional regulator
MIRTQIQFPDPLYRRLKEIAEQKDWSLSEVMRKAAEHFVERFPPTENIHEGWQFPTLDCGRDFLVDPALICSEADAIERRDSE